MVCHWMVVLSENYAYSIVICISLNIERLLHIRKGEYWRLAQAMLQIIKCSLFFLPPHEIFPATSLGHLVEGPCNMGESQHEPLVEDDQYQESLKLGQCGRGWGVLELSTSDASNHQMLIVFPSPI
jgi:hypothetical protein